MKLSDFDYKLPNDLIARYPTEKRSHSRLLCLDKNNGEIRHQQFFNLVDFLKPNDLLVFNNSKVIPARVYGQKATGGKIEILVERVLSEKEALAHVRASKSPKVGGLLYFDEVEVEVFARAGDLFHLKLIADISWLDFLEKKGHMPLPPYFERDGEALDKHRYQTVYAEPEGSVAAPTAGLHFDETLIEEIQAKHVDCAFLTLHVGAGTFQPVRVEDVSTHKMHAEFISVPESVCEKIKKTKENNGRVIAVGTTSVRSLETASFTGEIKPYHGDTDIFIYPGVKFNCIDAMITNFHLPKSSLLMLVSAFAGSEQIKQAYQTAIKENYRFYSYGDAMLIY